MAESDGRGKRRAAGSENRSRMPASIEISTASCLESGGVRGGVEGAPWGAATAESEERRWLRVAGGVFNKKERKAVTEC